MRPLCPICGKPGPSIPLAEYESNQTRHWSSMLCLEHRRRALELICVLCGAAPKEEDVHEHWGVCKKCFKPKDWFEMCSSCRRRAGVYRFAATDPTYGPLDYYVCNSCFDRKFAEWIGG